MPDSSPLSLMFFPLVQYNILSLREGTNLPELIPSARAKAVLFIFGVGFYCYLLTKSKFDFVEISAALKEGNRALKIAYYVLK